MPIDIISMTLSELVIPFRQVFKHNSAERARTQSVIVEVRSGEGLLGFGEACPRSYVTGETIKSAVTFFNQHRAALINTVHELSDLKQWLQSNRAEINRNPAAWCAIEMALLDVLARCKHQSVEALLGLPELAGNFQYSAILGDSEPEVFQKLLNRYYSQGFRDYKIKLSGDLKRDKEKLAHFASLEDKAIKIRVDANNLWSETDEVLAYIKALPVSIWAIEEPLADKSYEKLALISELSKSCIILDESFLRYEQFELLDKTKAKWIINLRVSKMGGLLRSLQIAEHATQQNIPLIIGAQVGETSLLTRAALTLSNNYHAHILAREGGFGTLLLQQDVCDPPVMMDDHGKLSMSHDSQVGFGLVVDRRRI